MTQLFKNNASTTLNGSITNSATSIVVVNGAVFSSPTGSDFELLTITDGTNIEIVKMTARSTNTLTVTRAQEGTTGIAFASGSTIQGRITKETLEKFPQLDNGGDAKGVGSINLQSSRTSTSNVASGQYAIAIGRDSKAVGYASIAIGLGANATGTSICIGNSSLSAGDESTIIGESAQADSNASSVVLVGKNCHAGQDGSTCIGNGAEVDGPGTDAGYACSAIGGGSYVGVDVHHASAIGAEAYVDTDNSMNFSAMPIIRRGFQLNNDELDSFSGSEAVLFSNEIDLKTLMDDAVAITLPTNTHFYPDELGIVITTVSGITTNPDISFGITGNTTSLLASTTVTAVTQFDRTKYTPLSINGKTSLTASVKTAATGTTVKGRFYWKGIFVRDE